jgi:hypothetical protein
MAIEIWEARNHFQKKQKNTERVLFPALRPLLQARHESAMGLQEPSA